MIRVDWPSLEQLKFTRDTRVTTDIANVSLKCGLLYLLASLDALERCEWRVEDGAVVISAREARD